MGKQTLTQWFPADVKPVHVGVYEYKYGFSGFKFMVFWDGKNYIVADDSDFRGMFLISKVIDSWRGLAVKP